MKHVLFILTILLLVSCGSKPDKNNQSIIGMEFQDVKQINALADYNKISDTSFYDNKFYEPLYGILHLQNQTHNLILFKSISRDSFNDITYKILDTLIIKNLSTPEVITIGYCKFNKDNNINFIAIVDKTDSLYIQNTKKVWRANTATHKIEIVNNLTEINCINEEFDALDSPNL